ncbi:MAG TPA: hypothetical protein VFS21_38680 [Roseiflexaceae bacterium]|nr:hypothetical protein [Roseiflexaceae bacterium]
MWTVGLRRRPVCLLRRAGGRVAFGAPLPWAGRVGRGPVPV